MPARMNDEDDGRAGVLGGGEAGEHEDAGADDAADADRGQRAPARAMRAQLAACRLRLRDPGSDLTASRFFSMTVLAPLPGFCERCCAAL